MQPEKPNTASDFDPTAIRRPDRVLMKYYFVIALLSGPLFPITIVPLFFKYETLRYRLDASGVSMSWDLLFRREIHLTYRRIQDIHLTRNLLQRWMGLATVAIQRLRHSRTAGLGDELHGEGLARAWAPGHIVALREIRDAARALAAAND